MPGFGMRWMAADFNWSSLLMAKTEGAKCRCDAVWYGDTIAYGCKTCGLSSASCICVFCFDAGDHEGHDFYISRSDYGCCDCGDAYAWRQSGFCRHHPGPRAEMDPSQLLPEATRRRAQLFLPAQVRRLVNFHPTVLPGVPPPPMPSTEWRHRRRVKGGSGDVGYPAPMSCSDQSTEVDADGAQKVLITGINLRVTEEQLKEFLDSKLGGAQASSASALSFVLERDQETKASKGRAYLTAHSQAVSVWKRTSALFFSEAFKRIVAMLLKLHHFRVLLLEAMQVQLQSETAKLPQRHHAGFSLYAAQPATIPARGKGVVKTGLAIAIPEDSYARVAPVSKIAAERMIETGAGVVDYDYRGEVGVVLFNHGPEDFSVVVGDEVAQLILEKICMAECREVESLDDTLRGSGGFGSTGVSEAAVKKQRIEDSQAVPVPSAKEMLVKRVNPSAVLPIRGSVAAAGFDLAAAEATSIPAGGKGVVKTGLCIAIPEGTYARVAPRSGLAVKKMLHTGAGVVDYDYRGEVGVVLFNHGTEDFVVAVGDRVAQLILEKISMADCKEVESLEAAATTAKANEEMLVKRVNPSAVLPIRGSVAAAGFDLAAAEATSIPAGGKGVVKTGLCIAIPEGTYARVAPRSGLAVKKMLHTGAGVVDYDYRGEVGVVLFNHGTEDFVVAVGDRVAQLILEQHVLVDCYEVKSLAETARGAGGFGSTGVSQALPKQETVPARIITTEQVTQLGA
eukprot:symbB.v1.2.031287.t1/scaffold3617.1/size53222/1